MSLLTRQLLLQAQSDHNDCLRRISVGEDTPNLQKMLRTTANRITDFQKQLADEEKKVKEKQAQKQKTAPATAAAPEAPKKPYTPRNTFPSDINLNCCDCSFSFVFTGKEQLFYKRNGYAEPVRCADCREEKKKNRPAGKAIQCGDCEKPFFFSSEKKKEFEERKWPEPKFCYDCRGARKTAYANKKAAEAAAPKEEAPKEE